MTSSANLTILLPLKDRVPFTDRWLAYAASCRAAVPHSDRRWRGRRHDRANGGGEEVSRSRHRIRPLSVRQHLRRLLREARRCAVAGDHAVGRDGRQRRPVRPAGPGARRRISVGALRVRGVRRAMRGVLAPGHRHFRWGRDVTARTSNGNAAASSQPTSPTPPGERLRERCRGANDVFYAVHRTDLLRRHFEAVRDCNPRDLFLMEQLVMFLTAIAGKTRQLDTLYIARQQDSPGSSGGAHQDRFGDWFDRMLLPTWSEDFTRFVDCASRGAVTRRRHPRRGGPPDRRRVLQDVGGAVAARRPG